MAADDDRRLRSALGDPGVPPPRPGFWDELQRKVESETSEHARRTTRTRSTRARRLVVAAGAAACVVLVGVLLVLLSQPSGEEVEVRVGDGDEVTLSEEAAQEQAVDLALSWIDRLAAGDVAGAWERFGLEARQHWGSQETFEEAHEFFADGLAFWSDPDSRTAAVSSFPYRERERMHVVTITGVRDAEELTGEVATAIMVAQDTAGRFRIAAFDPTIVFGRPGFMSSMPRAQPGQLFASEPLRVGLPRDEDGLLVLNGDGPVVTPQDSDAWRPTVGSRAGAILPFGGWEPGPLVATYVVLEGDAAPMANAVAVLVVENILGVTDTFRGRHPDDEIGRPVIAGVPYGERLEARAGPSGGDAVVARLESRWGRPRVTGDTATGLDGDRWEELHLGDSSGWVPYGSVAYVGDEHQITDEIRTEVDLERPGPELDELVGQVADAASRVVGVPLDGEPVIIDQMLRHHDGSAVRSARAVVDVPLDGDDLAGWRLGVSAVDRDGAGLTLGSVTATELCASAEAARSDSC